MDLLQLVPTLPPSLSGVGDYALLLAQELAARHRVQTTFVVGDPGWRGQESAVAPFAAAAVPSRGVAALLRALDAAPAAPLLLHYVGYGYAHRGCPFWLVNALERWKAHARRRLIVIFHELYADSEIIWSSAFWTSPIQRWLAARLARLADIRRMTTTPAAGQLKRMLGAAGRVPGAAAVTPVFSTLGEPASTVPFAQRDRHMIVFGSRPWRVSAYTAQAADLAEACRRLQVERVIDVGSRVELPAGFPCPIDAAGALPAAEACALFARSLAGFFTYPVPYLGKSTIFAAYCSAGLVPVTHAANLAPSEDGLRGGEHYLLAGDPSGCPDIAAVASAAREWYNSHRLEIHASGIRQQMDAG